MVRVGVPRTNVVFPLIFQDLQNLNRAKIQLVASLQLGCMEGRQLNLQLSSSSTGKRGGWSVNIPSKLDGVNVLECRDNDGWVSSVQSYQIYNSVHLSAIR